MPLPDSHFVACFPLQEAFLDKDDGSLLSAGKVYFYRNDAPAVLKPVYKLVEASIGVFTFVELLNPIVLTSIGTFADDSGNDIIPYLYPYTGLPTDITRGSVDLYHIVVKSSGDILQFTRDAWPPNVEIDTSAINTFEGSDNQISNPQFVDTLLPAGGTQIFSVTGTNTETSIAPDWVLITTGTGTVTVTQENITNSAMPSGAPFAINITGSAAVTSMKLRQRISNTPRLFNEANSLVNSFVSSSLVAKSLTASIVQIQMDYIASNGYTVNLINQPTNATSTYSTLINSTAAQIISTNSDGGIAGYVDIMITIPTNTSVGITSIQVVSVFDESSSVEYIQESAPRQIDHLFHYYKPLLAYKPIPSLLTGWDFPLNPAQFGSTGTLTGANAYIWDQTIGTRGSTNTVAYARNSVSGGLQFTTGGSANAFYILQYLTGAQAKEMIGTKLSVNMHAYTDGAAAVTSHIYLFRGSSAATVPVIGAGSLGTLSSSGTFTLSQANWTAIPRGGLDVPSFTVNAVDTTGTDNDYGFSQWQITDSGQIADTDKFAILTTFTNTATPTVITVDSISVVKGSIPTRPGAQTPDQVLRECQFYYETSYPTGIAAGTSTQTPSALVFQQDGLYAVAGNDGFCATSFSIPYKVTKRIAPGSLLKLYNPNTGTVSQCIGNTIRDGAVVASANQATTVWTIAASSTTVVQAQPNAVTTLAPFATAASVNVQGAIFVHFEADSRLGKV